VACGSDLLNISCYDGDTVSIVSANYGRRDTITCPDNNADSVECIHADTLAFVEDR